MTSDEKNAFYCPDSTIGYGWSEIEKNAKKNDNPICKVLKVFNANVNRVSFGLQKDSELRPLFDAFAKQTRLNGMLSRVIRKYKPADPEEICKDTNLQVGPKICCSFQHLSAE